MAKPKIYDGQIPFTQSGNQQHYPEPWVTAQGGLVWKDNEIFTDTLTFDGFSRGRSAAYATFTRKSNGGEVVVFLTDLDVMIEHMHCGIITGEFTFCKRGMNYGCKLVNPSETA